MTTNIAVSCLPPSSFGERGGARSVENNKSERKKRRPQLPEQHSPLGHALYVVANFSDVVITWLPTVRQLFCVAAKVSLRQQQQRSRLKESSQHTCVHSSATTTLSFFSPPMSPIFVAARSKTRRLTSKGAVDHLRGLMSFLSGTTSGFVCFSVFA